MKEALSSYTQSILRVVREQDAAEKTRRIKVNLKNAAIVQNEKPPFYFPQISMPAQPAGYIKASKYDYY